MDILLIAEGQLAATETDLYSVPSGKTAIIKSIVWVNGNTSVETVNLYIMKAGSSSRMIIPKDYQMGVQYMARIGDELTLEAGDKIRGFTTTASKVDYTIHGVEK